MLTVWADHQLHPEAHTHLSLACCLNKLALLNQELTLLEVPRISPQIYIPSTGCWNTKWRAHLTSADIIQMTFQWQHTLLCWFWRPSPPGVYLDCCSPSSFLGDGPSLALGILSSSKGWRCVKGNSMNTHKILRHHIWKLFYPFLHFPQEFTAIPYFHTLTYQIIKMCFFWWG